MDFELNEEQKEFQQLAADFAEKELAPFAGEWDEEKTFPVDTLRKAAELGFLGLYVPEKLQGMGLSRLDSAIIFEEMAGGCVSTTAYMTIHNMVNWMVATFASPALAETYCPKMCAGEILSSYCLTEPGSGSDAASLKTSAVAEGNDYYLSGEKAFISGAGETGLLVVMARTGGEGPKGISAFLVDADSEGIEYGKNEHKMGWNSQPTKAVVFDQCRVPAANMLGKPGEGFRIAMKALNGGRINIGTCSVGAAAAALRQTLAYTSTRKQFGKTLDSFQNTSFGLSDMLTGLTASRQMIRLAASKLDAGHPDADVYCAMAKMFATERCFAVIDQALQMHGGYGYIKEYPLERLLRDTRVHRILEGTNEVMRLIISRKMIESHALPVE